MKKNKEIILGVTAGVAVYKACDIVRRLREQGCSVTVVMTREAQEFIRPLLFASLSGNRVYADMFAVPEEWDVRHVSLAQKADLVLIAPATANIIGKIAGGLSDDPVTCVVCATRAPVVICPAMNEQMYRNAIVQRNIRTLKTAGYAFVDPVQGRLACGSTGIGCLADVERIVAEALKRIA